MARIRTIKPDFFQHDGIADLPPLSRLLFIGLWQQADREGRLDDRPKRLKVAILPYDDCDIDAMLADLDAAGFIVRYEAEGERFIEIPSFAEHQNPHQKEPASTIPPSSRRRRRRGQTQASTSLAPGKPDAGPSCVTGEHESGREEGKGREGKGKEGKGTDGIPDPAPCQPDARSFALAERLRDRILAHKPDAKLPATLDRWADTMRLMLDRDGRSPERIVAVIDWTTAEPFWQPNVLSADKLREKFDVLEGQMRRPRARPAQHAADRTMDAIQEAFGVKT